MTAWEVTELRDQALPGTSALGYLGTSAVGHGSTLATGPTVTRLRPEGQRWGVTIEPVEEPKTFIFVPDLAF